MRDTARSYEQISKALALDTGKAWTPLGYLVQTEGGLDVVCPHCWEGTHMDGTPILFENIWPYWQDCMICKVSLVKGHAGWPVLFDGKGVTP